MDMHLIKGAIEALGDSSRRIVAEGVLKHTGPYIGPRKYEFIEFREENGEKLLVKNISVHPDVNRLLAPGVEGVFVVGKGLGGREMYAARVGSDEGLKPNIDMGTTKFYVIVSIIALIAIPLCFILIGIPVLLACIWGMIRFPKWRALLADALQRGGFTMRGPRVI
jgi:hypothetical protein